MKRFRPSIRLSLTAGMLLVCAAVLSFSLSSRAASVSPRHALSSAWSRAADAGAYGFVTDIRQEIVPQSTVRNVGHESKEQSLHLEGDTNLPEREMSLTLWSQGGSVLDAASGVEIRVEGDRAYARAGGQDWREINNFVGSLAPQGDFMAYLSAAQDGRDRTQRGEPPGTVATRQAHRRQHHIRRDREKAGLRETQPGQDRRRTGVRGPVQDQVVQPLEEPWPGF